MAKNLVCSDCGEKFTDVETTCPGCNRAVVDIKPSAGTNDYVGVVE